MVAFRKDEAKSVAINLRASARKRALIDRAAEVVGKTRTEFILDSASRAAEDVLLDQRLFLLDEARYAAFVEALDAAPRPTPRLRRLLAGPAPWED